MITDDSTPEVKVTDLSEDHLYRFRVKAVNAAGPSWPSEPTDEVVCKASNKTVLIIGLVLMNL